MRALLLLLAALPSALALDLPALEVLVLDDGDGNADDLVAEVESYGHAVDLSSEVHGFYEYEFTGEEVSLDDYQAVIWLDGGDGTFIDMDSDGQEALETWTEDGGALLLFGSTGYNRALGSYSGISDLIPLVSSSYLADRTFTCADDSHPVASGYTDGETFDPVTGVITDNTAAFGTTVFTFRRGGSDRAGVVAAEPGSGRLVHYAFWGNTTAYYAAYETDWEDPDVSQLVENGLQWSVQRPPEVELDGPWSVDAEDSITLSAEAYDPDGGDLDYAWEAGATRGSAATLSFSAAGYDGPDTASVSLTVTDDEGEETTATGTITVRNVAPVITSGPGTSETDEGTALSLSVDYTDVEAADTHDLTWDMGDGTVLTGSSVSHSYGDDGRFTVTVTVEDDDGGSDSATALQRIGNVAPTLTGTPDSTVEEGRSYAFTPGVDDPGTDDTFTFDGTLADGARLDAADGSISWTPSWEDIGSHAFRLTVEDDDGGRDSLDWTVEVTLRDDDGDGMSDGWEEDYGLDPDDPDDAAADPDGDGRTNLDEWEGGTDPGVDEGPGQPELLAPTDGDEVAEVRTTLQIGTAVAPLGQPLSYGFLVYSDADLTTLVASADGVGGGSDGDGTVEWRVAEALDENTDYWWTATASDAYTTTEPVAPAWTFFVNAVNEAPTVPVPYTPFDGGIVDTLRPELVLTGSTDPDRDRLSYTVVLESEDGAELARTTDLPDEGGTARWSPDLELSDETGYCWSAWATDEHGLDGEPSDPACFFVDLFNDAPSAPAFVAPEDGGVVASLQPVLTVEDGVDPEGRATIHEFELDRVDSFDSADLQVGSTETDGDGRTSWTVPEPLGEDSSWYARARCNDGGQASDWVGISFSVSAGNGAPGVPELRAPLDGDEVDAAPSLVVGNSPDPEGDAVSYDFRVRDRDGGTAAEATAVAEDAAGETRWSPGPLSDGIYAWSARAVDEGGAASDWAIASVFAVVDGVVVGDAGDTDSGTTGSGATGSGATIAGTGCSCSAAGGSAPAGTTLALFGGLAALLGLRRRSPAASAGARSRSGRSG